MSPHAPKSPIDLQAILPQGNVINQHEAAIEIALDFAPNRHNNIEFESDWGFLHVLFEQYRYKFLAQQCCLNTEKRWNQIIVYCAMSFVAAMFILVTILAYFVAIASFVYFLSMLYTATISTALVLKASTVALLRILFQNYSYLVLLIYENIQVAEGLYSNAGSIGTRH